MGEPWRIRNTIVIVNYRENTGVRFKTSFLQLIQCPKRLRRNRITRGTVTCYRIADDIFGDRFCAPYVFPEFLSFTPANHLVTIAMTANFVARFENIADQLG